MCDCNRPPADKYDNSDSAAVCTTRGEIRASIASAVAHATTSMRAEHNRYAHQIRRDLQDALDALEAEPLFVEVALHRIKAARADLLKHIAFTESL